jgi:ribonuclease HII
LHPTFAYGLRAGESQGDPGLLRIRCRSSLTLVAAPDAGSLVAGVDEVGRGPLAGPVVAAAVILPQPIDGIADSKQLSPKERVEVATAIVERAWFGIGAASVGEIDRINILQATMLAMQRAVARLPVQPHRVMVDGNRAPCLPCPAECVIDGDALVPAIGAASILAKVLRDRLMQRLACRYPGYGFATNVGYGTPEHLTGLERHGPTRHHRGSFAPIRQLTLALLDP